jgi:two-component system, OmpR family, response regulator
MYLSNVTSLRVLIADDSSELRERLVEMLSQVPGLGVVGQAGCVADALTALNNLDLDLVILDLQMRDGSGMEVLRELRRSHFKTKVIVFTNHPEEQYRRRCATLGANYFLSKSTDSNLLLEITRQLASTPGDSSCPNIVNCW